MSEGHVSVDHMSPGIDSLSRGASRESRQESRHVRMQDTPEYIPMLNTGMLYQMGCGTPTVGQSQYGKKKAVEKAEDESEKPPTDTDQSGQDGNGVLSGIGLHTATKIIMQTKKLAKRAKVRSGKRAAKALLKQASVSGELFKNYSLTDVHNKIKRQRQIRLAFLQKRFLDELPVLAERSVKEHIAKRIEILETLKMKSFMTDGKQLEQLEQYDRPNSRILTRRQSQLRKSLDASNFPLDKLVSDLGVSGLTPTAEDLEKLLAIAKSREKIEADLDLPLDRMQRLSELRQNVDKINAKFKSLRNKKSNANKTDTGENKEETIYYAPSRFTKIGMVSTNISFYTVWATS